MPEIKTFPFQNLPQYQNTIDIFFIFDSNNLNPDTTQTVYHTN